MNNSSATIGERQFSPQARAFLSAYAILDEAEGRLWQEWRAMLGAVADELHKDGYLTEINVDSRNRNSTLKAFLPDWPQPYSSCIHIEVDMNTQMFIENRFEVTLDVEDSTPGKDRVLRSLESLLMRHYQSRLFTPATGATLVPGATGRICRRSLPLPNISSRDIADALHRLARVESFVDEACFLATKTQRVWRTDFLPRDHQPVIDISFDKGGSGGWKASGCGGRLDSPCLELVPGMSNYQDGMNILMFGGELFRGFKSGRQVYGSAIVQSPKGGELDLILQTSGACGFTIAFTKTASLDENNQWQHLTWEGEIPQVKGHDLGEEGVYAYLIASPVDGVMKVDSLEIGLA